MSKSKEIVQIRRLSGVSVRTSSFCVRPDGKTAFIFDPQSYCFIEINLNDGQTRRYKIELAKTISGLQIWYQIRAIVRGSQTILLHLISEKKTKKCFLVSFSLSEDNISVIHEHYLGIVETNNSLTIMIADEKGNVHVVSCGYPTARQTVFDVVKVDVENDGSIASQILFRQYLMNGYMFQPFILSGAINFIDGYTANNKRLLTIPFDSKRAVEIKLANDDNDSWPFTSAELNWYPPCAVGDRIFYYVRHVRKKKGILVYCDWNNKCWKQVGIDMKDHVIIDFHGLDHSAYDGHLYLSGTCSLESCTEKSHIYVFDMKNKPKKEARDAAQKQPDNQGSTRSTRGAIEVPNSSVSSIIAKLNQLQSLDPKSNILLPTDERVRIQGLKVALKQNMSSSENLPAQNKLNQVSGKIVEGQTSYQSAVGIHPTSQWTPIKFMKEEELGSGQFGVVYKCRDEESKRYFVAKYTILQTDQNMAVAENEVKRLQGLSYHRIIEYYGCKLENKTMIIFMEYMPLGSIRKIIDKHGAIGEKTAIIYTSQILEGLAYIHDKGIVHCDLKCDNLLCDANGNVKIGDFGIAVQRLLNAEKSYINPNSLGMVGGTIFWCAPEVFETQTVSRKSDMWSLGCTIVEMLATKPPYAHMKTIHFLRSQPQLTYDVNELVSTNINAPMRSFLTTLLQRDLSKRLKTGQEGIEKFKELGLL